jgi:Ca-activated chloride channel family protein
MKRSLPAVALLLVWCSVAPARGLLIPEEKTVPPLAMLNHKVSIAIEDQVSITKVEQTFRNHTDRPLEATYIFPVPKGASVSKFTMFVDGKEVKGELVEAKKAREIYTSIVRRTQDPGLLEYVDNNLLQMKVFPIPAHGDQKVTLSYTSIADKNADLVEYVYPLKTDGKATATLESFSIEATIKSQHAVQNVYSPTHAITLKRKNDKELTVNFDRNQGLLDKDFQLFYQLGDKDVGLTALTHRPISAENGYFLALITPKVEMKKEYEIPRDVVMVLDTSGSMRGVKMEQAKKALKVCLENLGAKDRFALINFATTVNKYRDNLLDVTSEQMTQANKWVDNLEATGGTAINDALTAALELRTKEEGRNFTIIFFTDGEPTIGETNVEKILKNTFAKNSANTRIFTFGVGDDVNASLLDKLAEGTRAVSTYVRPAEDISAKTASLCDKISHPALSNLKLTTTADVRFVEVYPAQLPDLFHGQQLVVLGRYTGKGSTAIKLTGTVGKETKEFVYELNFPEKTNDDHAFVEEIWARRKVGYLLDQVRENGEKKELVDEIVTLAKKYGITTPYTSYLIVPDSAVPVLTTRAPGTPPVDPRFGGEAPAALTRPANAPIPVTEFLKEAKDEAGLRDKRRELEGDRLNKIPAGGASGGPGGDGKGGREEKEKLEAFEAAKKALGRGDKGEVQTGKLGVDLAVQMEGLRRQNRLETSAVRNVNGRRCLELAGLWVDEGYASELPKLVVKAQSDAYFKILELQPKMKDVFRLGNHLVWVTPNGTALIIDTREGKETLGAEEIDKLFVAKK